MTTPGRKFSASSSSYRYGFNGKENDNEVKGEGNQIDYGMRIYDPRLGKFLSVDLLTRKYPMLSPFQYASNRPIDGIDLDGLEYLPYHKSMYQLEYSTITSTITSRNGKQTTATTGNVIVNTVYANIPTALQDSKTNSFKYVSGGPVTAWGRDWDTDKDGAIVYQAGKYYQKGPKFYGMADGGQDPEPTASTSGMGGGAVNSARNNVANAAAGALGEEGAGVIANQFNKKIWNALGKEKELRKGFYNATNMVDAYRSNNLIGDKSLLNASGRTGLINFLTDGSLNTSFADGLKDGFVNDHSSVWADYSTIRRNIYGNALRVAYTGLQIMQQQGIEIRAETISAVQGTLQKYKANGGGTEYDNINQFTTPKK
jgi:RHS repeat-associated protein